jgi:hypothetical protein
MKRRTPLATTVPADLRSFDPARWVQDAIDHADPILAPLVRRMSFAELCTDPYATGVVARARYRLALWDAVGQVAGDRWFYER